MMDPDRSRQREHWQAIAEQLGLAAEPEEQGGPQAKLNVAPSKREENQAAQAPAPLVEPEKRSREPPPRRGGRSRSARGDEPEQREKSRPRLHEEAARKETGAEPTRSAEEGTGRGRRRRSPRSAAATESTARGSDADVDSPSARETTGKPTDRPKRGRGRGRQKAAKAVNADREPAAKQEIGKEVAVSQGAEDAELDDVRSLSNWNVPSWNELIASLYRPER